MTCEACIQRIIEASDFYVNIRPSGTEDLIRLNVEAKNERMLRKIIKNIEEVIGL